MGVLSNGFIKFYFEPSTCLTLEMQNSHLIAEAIDFSQRAKNVVKTWKFSREYVDTYDLNVIY